MLSNELARFAIGPGVPRRRLAGTCVVLSLFALLAPASQVRAATEAEQAEALIREGVQLRGQDQTGRALPLFEKAYRISRTPRTAGQLGLCELELRDYAEAELHLTEALAAPDHPWIAKNRATLKRQLDMARANVGELALTVSPAHADVLLNNKPADRARLGVPIHLGKGPVEVEVLAPGYEPARETITIVAGKRAERSYALVLLPPPPNMPAADSGPFTPAIGSPPAATGKSDPRRIAAWITGGGALAAMALGTVEAFNAASKRDAFNDHTGVVGGTALPDCTTVSLSAQCKPLKDAYDSALTLSIVGFVSAGALAAASSVLFVLSSSGHVRTAERAGVAPGFACVPDLGVRGLGCSLRF